MRMMSSSSMVNCPIIHVYDYMPNVIASLNHKAPINLMCPHHHLQCLGEQTIG